MSLRNGTAGRRGRQITCAWRTWQGYNLDVLPWSWLTSMSSGLLQKDLFKRKWSLAKSYFKQNYCHACHKRFAVFFPLPSCCVSSLLIDHRGRQNVVKTTVTHSPAARVPLLCFYDILTSSVIYYWTDARQHGIYLLSVCSFYVVGVVFDLSVNLSPWWPLLWAFLFFKRAEMLCIGANSSKMVANWNILVSSWQKH